MNKFHNIINQLKALYEKHETKLANIFFGYFAITFLIDQAVNYAFHFPFFVVSALAVLPLLFISTIYQNPDKRNINIFLFIFITITIVNNLIFGFHRKNLSDLLFIFLFITFYYNYKKHMHSLNQRFVYSFLGICLFIFSFTFFAMDSQSINRMKSTVVETSVSETEIVNETSTTINTDESNSDPTQNTSELKWEANPHLDYVEYQRIYHNGLFRLPHTASYFFGFLSLFFMYRYWRKNKTIDLIILITSFILCLSAGSRAVIAAFGISVILFLAQQKYIVYLQGLIIAGLLMFIGIEHILRLTENTVFYQYFSLIQTSSENFTRLSRFRIWYSWWGEVNNFRPWDFLIGKSYINAHLANIKNLAYDIWFHNDFLNIFFSYGIGAAALYVWFFIKIYRDNKEFIKNNVFIFIFYFSMVITAVINGFYYYFPVFLLYFFWLMIKNERELSCE